MRRWPLSGALADIADKLSALLANVIALGGGKPPKIPPYRRPGEARRVAAKARLREQARAEWNAVLDQLGVEH